MATLSAAPPSTSTSDGEACPRGAQPQSPADPFYHATPRSHSPGWSTVVAARQQVAPPPPLPARLDRQPAPRARIPACTHVKMARVYGANHCQNCGRVPSIGWLYACRQDSPLAVHHLSVSDSLDSLPIVADSGSYFEAQAQIAASIGMSASIIKQMRTGAYTFDQIETLLAQRRHVIETIRRTKNPSTSSLPPTPKHATYGAAPTDGIITSVGTTASPIAQNYNIAALPMPPAGTPNNTPAESQTTTPKASTPIPAANSSPNTTAIHEEPCTYMVCHNCRPFFQDRLQMSMDPALNNKVSTLREQDLAGLPVHDASLVSRLGLRHRVAPTPLRRFEESMDITAHRRDGNGYESFGQDTSSDWTPTTTSSEADSDLSDKFDLSPCPGPEACPVWLDGQGCAYDWGFDDGKREINHGYTQEERRLAHGLGIAGTDLPHPLPVGYPSTPDHTPSKGSSVSLPNLSTTPLTRATLSSNYSSSLPDRSSRRSKKSSNSSNGSEVGVAGGVALTEEAVESGTPDVVVA